MYQYGTGFDEVTLSPAVIASLIGLLVMFLFGVPIWVSLGITAFCLLYVSDVIPLSLIGESLFAGLDTFPLVAVPLFILTGDALVRTGLSDRLLDVAQALLGWVKSGFGTSTLLGCGFFSCISGSDAAGAAAMGRIATGRLIDSGYPLPYASALVASGSCTGILIPPSIGYIIIGLVLGLSASTLFIAAIIPGVLVLLAIMLCNVVVNRFTNYETSREHFDAGRLVTTLYEARFALLVPFLILGGIYSGVFTPTEAAGFAVTLIVFIGLATGSLRLKDLPDMLLSSVKVNGVIVPIIAVSLPLAQAIALLQIPDLLVAELTAISQHPAFIIGVMLAIFMLAGAFMEATPNIVIFGPLLLPLAQEIGMTPVHFSIFMLTTLGLGFITPPLGLNLFVLSAITGASSTSIAYRAIPFVVAMFAAAVVIAAFPQLSLFFLD